MSKDLKNKVQIKLRSSHAPTGPRLVCSNHALFDDEVFVRRTGNTMSIRRAGIDYTGKSYKPYHSNGSPDKHFQLSGHWPPGLYEINEELSTEDLIIVNLSKPI